MNHNPYQAPVAPLKQALYFSAFRKTLWLVYVAVMLLGIIYTQWNDWVIRNLHTVWYIEVIPGNFPMQLPLVLSLIACVLYAVRRRLLHRRVWQAWLVVFLVYLALHLWFNHTLYISSKQAYEMSSRLVLILYLPAILGSWLYAFGHKSAFHQD